ncbi:MAG: hypothetical protein ABIH23_09050 [bacterium]
MIEKSQEGSMIYFDFLCPGCGAQGELGIDAKDGMKPLGCPEGCGSTFVPWKPDNKWRLKCVVQRCEMPEVRA